MNMSSMVRPRAAHDRAFLSAALEGQALDHVRALCSRIERERAQLRRQPGALMRGSAPAALLLASAAVALDAPSLIDSAIELADHAIASMHQEDSALYSGAPGVLWAALSMDALLGTDEYADIADDYDEYLLESLDARQDWPGHFDLVSGLAGIGVYALQRHASRLGPDLIGAVLRHLERMSVRSGAGLYWPTRRHMLAPGAIWRGGELPEIADLGMAHGNAGMVALLSVLSELAGAAPSTAALRDAALTWLLAQPARPAAEGVFRNSVDDPSPSRGAWCYGDVAIANAMLLAARATASDQLALAGRALVHGVCQRSPASLQLADPWICHGHAGLAHFLRRACLGAPNAVWQSRSRDFFEASLVAQRAAPAANAFALLEGQIGTSLCYLDALGLLPFRWDLPFLFI